MQTHWKNAAPQPPFYAVVFVSIKREDLEGYQAMDELMMTEAQKQPGYLGYSSAGQGKGGIFISYWQDQNCIENWRQHAGHMQAKGQATRWYQYFHTLICEVKSHREFLSESKFLG